MVTIDIDHHNVYYGCGAKKGYMLTITYHNIINSNNAYNYCSTVCIMFVCIYLYGAGRESRMITLTDISNSNHITTLIKLTMFTNIVPPYASYDCTYQL